MAKTNPRKQEYINIEGDVSGQIAIGHSIQQTQSSTNVGPLVSRADLEMLRVLFEISQKVPADQREKALEKVTELQGAITDEKPDLTTMEYVRNWFGKNVPQLVVHPIVGKLVEAAGEALVHEFKRRFEIPWFKVEIPRHRGTS